MEEQLHLLTGSYALNALTPAERDAFERHALDNPDTLEEVRSLSQTAALLAYDTTAQTPPPEVKAHIMAAIRNTRQLPATAIAHDPTPARNGARETTRAGARRRRSTPERRRWVPALAAAATLLLLAGTGGWAIGQATSHQGLEHQLAQAQASQAHQQALLAIMAAPDAKVATTTLPGNATITIAWSTHANHAAITTHDLPTLPNGKTYELWYITTTTTHPAGLLPTTPTTTPQLLNGTLNNATHIGITIEPPGGSPQPTTTPILLQTI
ncbi:anti-sigma factor domain-containing protein [Arthrobacter sp. STN4]|uniref:anti-sigma factor n=1 Tax=Arthrobacter sp. STN4 TaxID=2923276 RepID=UPI002119E148|nr:anti-sigma factor [Arthrobacter sp. STN4]MCQ9166168.1 anti-sigma factor [Arthrobacter sp. STN4]